MSTPLTLGQKQMEFTRCLAKLIEWAYGNGYELTVGDAYRDPRAFGPMGTKVGYSHPSSNHKQRLAMDFNLFKDGKFLQSSEDHKPLGDYWKTLHPLARWGGDFNDGNHYSFEHNGVK